MTRTLRRSHALPLVLAPALLVAACGGSGTAAESAPGPSSARSLTIALSKDSGPLNIFAGQTDQMTELIYDKLLSPSPYVADPQPWL
ncbi:MAG: hypothetical protein ACR2I3_18795, partial [Rhodococcus sp. (in: high G+C Gram-positive bacteria)]